MRDAKCPPILGGHLEKWLRECGSVGIVYGREVPGEEFVDPVDRVLGDAGQDLAELAFGIESIEFRRSDQRVDGGRSLPPGVRATEKVVLASEGDGAKRPFCRRVVDLQQSIVDVAGERTPVRERIEDRTRSLALGGQ